MTPLMDEALPSESLLIVRVVPRNSRAFWKSSGLSAVAALRIRIAGSNDEVP
jgi:hypothetical protein